MEFEESVLMRVKVILQEFEESVLMVFEESVLIGVKVIRVEWLSRELSVLVYCYFGLVVAAVSPAALRTSPHFC
jgi:hypothetical protein